MFVNGLIKRTLLVFLLATPVGGPIFADDTAETAVTYQNSTTDPTKADFASINNTVVPYRSGYTAELSDGTKLPLIDSSNPAAGYRMPSVTAQNQTQTLQIYYRPVPAASSSAASISSATVVTSSQAPVSSVAPTASESSSEQIKAQVVTHDVKPASKTYSLAATSPKIRGIWVTRLVDFVATHAVAVTTTMTAGVSIIGLWWLYEQSKKRYVVKFTMPDKLSDEQKQVLGMNGIQVMRFTTRHGQEVSLKSFDSSDKAIQFIEHLYTVDLHAWLEEIGTNLTESTE